MASESSPALSAATSCGTTTKRLLLYALTSIIFYVEHDVLKEMTGIVNLNINFLIDAWHPVEADRREYFALVSCSYETHKKKFYELMNYNL